MTIKKKTTKKATKKTTKKRVKTGGRKKGTPNKSSLQVKEIAEKLNFSPFEVMALFAMGDWKSLGYDEEQYSEFDKNGGIILKDRITPQMRLDAAKAAAPFIHPKLSSIEANSKVTLSPGEVIAEVLNEIEGESDD